MPTKHNDEQKKTLNKRFLYAKFQRSSEIPAIILFLIKKHIVKDEESARRLLVIVVLVTFLISIYLIFKCVNEPIFIDKITR